MSLELHRHYEAGEPDFSDVTLPEVARMLYRLNRTVDGNGQPGLRTQVTTLVTWSGEHDKRHTREVGTVRLDKKMIAMLLSAVGGIATVISAWRGQQ
jgi:hypothetical protein